MERHGSAMRAVLNKDHLKPYFQPIICVDKSGVFAYEVLGRNEGPWGVESMGPFFHNTGILPHEKARVDRVIRFKALEQLKKANRSEFLFINIQPRWLLPFINETGSFPTLQELARQNMDGSQIVIEICEDEFEEDSVVLLELVERYREAGCKIAVDDFGEGFSSLARITLLRPDYLKIGAGTITSDSDPEYGRYIMEAMGTLCEKSGTNLVLEEVESMEQFLMGLDAGVRFFQGHFFARPGPGFLDPDIYREHIKTGLCRYIIDRTSRELKTLELSRKMNEFIKNLARDYRGIDIYNLEGLVAKLTQAALESWLRIYVCNDRGYQITPNYTRREETRWIKEPQYLGRNWCWRPYYLPRVIEARARGMGVFSRPYLDLESRKKIWTLVFPLPQDLFLFVDCRYY